MKKTLKKLTIVALILTMALGVTLSGCGKEEKMVLKQGFYSTDDGMVGIDLHGESEFALQIMIMSNLHIGNYYVDNGKLILHYTPDDDLVFEIGNDKLTYLGFDEDSHLVEEWVIPIGTVLKKEEKMVLKQGFYSTDDGMVGIDLHGENEFALQIIIMSHLPIGYYYVDNGKLILHYTPDDDLVFEIGNDKLTYLGFNEGSHLVEEWVIQIGTVLRFVENV